MKKKLFTLIMMLISFSIQIFAQMRDYTAMVVDAETGEALHYASVYIAENRGTITNQDGKFLISASPEEILQIKFIGYENLRIKASEMRDVIRLKPATHTMQEVSVFPVMELLKNITTKLNGEYKKNNNIAILQTSRWDAILAKVVEKGHEHGLTEKFVKDFFNAIHEASVEVQNEIISNKSSE